MENYPQSFSINMQPYGRNGGATTPTPVSTPPPKDFVLWSFFNAIYCNPFCLGFLALVFSIKARDRTVAKDPMAASSYGRTARSLNIAACCLGIVGTIILLVLVILYRPVRP
ncbi:dispanin subfamily A member 2b-like isoform X2 [Cygnus atratus]|uniref:dispanin subfamily A member 2b-like isoform X2 n=1 Tax=Cygnus atratus TaxID=8868 RepID=UPI0015D59D1B|nr:dispanin subfamily A member 2b-like isoform X2 [Cygnus atratus]